MARTDGTRQGPSRRGTPRPAGRRGFGHQGDRGSCVSLGSIVAARHVLRESPRPRGAVRVAGGTRGHAGEKGRWPAPRTPALGAGSGNSMGYRRSAAPIEEAEEARGEGEVLRSPANSAEERSPETGAPSTIPARIVALPNALALTASPSGSLPGHSSSSLRRLARDRLRPLVLRNFLRFSWLPVCEQPVAAYPCRSFSC